MYTFIPWCLCIFQNSSVVHLSLKYTQKLISEEVKKSVWLIVLFKEKPHLVRFVLTGTETTKSIWRDSNWADGTKSSQAWPREKQANVSPVTRIQSFKRQMHLVRMPAFCSRGMRWCQFNNFHIQYSQTANTQSFCKKTLPCHCCENALKTFTFMTFCLNF